ncbi:MAG: glycosyltransferase [Opitutales bacterium]
MKTAIPMPDLPLVTVAIATYNRADLLRQALQGITQQEYPGDRLELLVIDNRSTDDTREVVDSFQGAPHPPRYILETQPGANFARNRAIREGRGEIIAFLDDDVLVKPDWLQELVAPFAQDEAGKIGAVGGEVIPVFPDGRPDWIARFHGPQSLRPDPGPIRPEQVPMGANLAFRRQTLVELGAFDTAVTRQGGRIFSADENLLIRRLWQAGHEAWFAPRACVRHQMPASRTTLRYARRHAFDSARSRVITQVRMDREEGRPSSGYLWSRLGGNLLKAVLFALVAGLNFMVGRGGAGKASLVRAWRSCGYLYQIPRSLCGLI